MAWESGCLCGKTLHPHFFIANVSRIQCVEGWWWRRGRAGQVSGRGVQGRSHFLSAGYRGKGCGCEYTCSYIFTLRAAAECFNMETWVHGMGWDGSQQYAIALQGSSGETAQGVNQPTGPNRNRPWTGPHKLYTAESLNNALQSATTFLLSSLPRGARLSRPHPASTKAAGGAAPPKGAGWRGVASLAGGVGAHPPASLLQARGPGAARAGMAIVKMCVVTREVGGRGSRHGMEYKATMYTNKLQL